jgi:hypothetical protein
MRHAILSKPVYPESEYRQQLREDLFNSLSADDRRRVLDDRLKNMKPREVPPIDWQSVAVWFALVFASVGFWIGVFRLLGAL